MLSCQLCRIPERSMFYHYQLSATLPVQQQVKVKPTSINQHALDYFQINKLNPFTLIWHMNTPACSVMTAEKSWVSHTIKWNGLG